MELLQVEHLLTVQRQDLHELRPPLLATLALQERRLDALEELPLRSSDVEVLLGRSSAAVLGGRLVLASSSVHHARVVCRRDRRLRQAIPHAKAGGALPLGPAAATGAGVRTGGGLGLHALPHLRLLGGAMQALLGLLLDRIGEEVRELLEQIGVVLEELGHLVQDHLDSPLLALVGVEDLEEGLVGVRVIAEALLDRGHVVDGMVELDGLAIVLGRGPMLHASRRGHVGGQLGTAERGVGDAAGARSRHACRISRPVRAGVVPLRLHDARGLHRRRLSIRPSGRGRAHRIHGRAAGGRVRAGAGAQAGRRASIRWCSAAPEGRSGLHGQRLRRPEVASRSRAAMRCCSGGRGGRGGISLPLNLLDVLELDLVALWKEGVEAQDEGVVAAEEVGHAADDARRVDLLGLEVLHDLQELVVDLRLGGELHLDLVQVDERILHFQLTHLLHGLPECGARARACSSPLWGSPTCASGWRSLRQLLDPRAGLRSRASRAIESDPTQTLERAEWGWSSSTRVFSATEEPAAPDTGTRPCK
mmetsp:Transcript_3267/g.13084  ORF Transcript_3267/g.13084 Transcript_3267/m.13084 type:complete len:534 (+) Transcript_3267:2754-4355(+)